MTVRTTWALRTAIVWGIAVGAGCKTTQEHGDHETSSTFSSGSLSSSSLTTSGWLAVHKISKSASQDVYLKILGTELDSGMKIAKDQMHTNKGLLLCRKNVDRDACTVRGRLEDFSLSVEQFMDSSVSLELSGFVRSARGDISPDQLVMADIECDYLGEKSPPFGVERASCRALHPRRLEEVVFGGGAAEILGQSLRGEESLGGDQKALKGGLACHVGDLNHRLSCFVRSLPEKGAKEKVVELPGDQVLGIARMIESLIADRRKLTSEDSTGKPNTSPLDVILALECRVDSRLVDSGGERYVECLGKI
jgi:hypothetical protein